MIHVSQPRSVKNSAGETVEWVTVTADTDPGGRLLPQTAEWQAFLAGHLGGHEEAETEVAPPVVLRQRTADEMMTYWAEKSLEWVVERNRILDLFQSEHLRANAATADAEGMRRDYEEACDVLDRVRADLQLVGANFDEADAERERMRPVRDALRGWYRVAPTASAADTALMAAWEEHCEATGECYTCDRPRCPECKLCPLCAGDGHDEACSREGDEYATQPGGTE